MLKVGRIDDPAVVEALLEFSELDGLLSLVHLLVVLHLHAPSHLSLRFLHDQPLIPRHSFLRSLLFFLESFLTRLSAAKKDSFCSSEHFDNFLDEIDLGSEYFLVF